MNKNKTPSLLTDKENENHPQPTQIPGCMVLNCDSCRGCHVIIKFYITVAECDIQLQL